MVAGSIPTDSRSPTRMLLVAAVFLLATLAPIAIPGVAGANQLTSLGVRVGPFFNTVGDDTFVSCPGAANSPALMVLPDYGKDDPTFGVWQTADIRVTTGYSSGVDLVRFLSPKVEWGTDLRGSTAAGYSTITTGIDPATGENALTFTGGHTDSGPTGTVFTVAFRIPKDAVGNTATTPGPGTVTINDGSDVVIGTDASFASFFAVGDTIRVSGDPHAYKVASVHPAGSVSGTATAGSDTTHLKDSTKDFEDAGVAVGGHITVSAGDAAGTYTVTSVTHDSLAFTPAAPHPIASGDAYSVEVANHIKLTMPVYGSSIQPSTGLPYVKLRIGTAATSTVYPIYVSGFDVSGSTEDTTPSQPSFCMVADNTAPRITGAVTRDTNFNGLLDELVITFNEEMDPDTFDPQAFLIDGGAGTIPYSVLPLTGASLTGRMISNDGELPCFQPNPAPTTCVFGTRTLKLSLAEGYHYDTGVVPQVTYPAPGHTPQFADLAGNPLGVVGTADVSERDGAKPVLVSMFAYEGATSIIATFSEPVGGSGPKTSAQPGDVDNCANPSGWPSTGLQCVRTTDFYYHDFCNGYTPNPQPQGPCNASASGPSHIGAPSNCISATAGVSPEIGIARHTPGPTTGNSVTLPILDATGNHEAAKCSVEGHNNGNPVIGFVGAGDANQVFGDVISLTQDPSAQDPCPAPDFAPCDAIVRDAAGLRGVPTGPCWPLNDCDAGITPVVPGSLPIHAPTTTQPLVRNAVINIDTASVTLNFNGPMSDATGDSVGIQPGALFIIAADGTGEGPGGITHIQHDAGSNRAVLTLDRKARPTDVDDTPARIGVRCNAIKGTHLNFFIPCSDPDKIGGPGVDLIDLVPPAILRLQTADLDRDGIVDGLFVEFNEPIDDSTFCMKVAPSPTPPFLPENQPPPQECIPCPTLACTGLLHIKPFEDQSVAGRTKFVFDTDAAPGGPGDGGVKFDTGNGRANDRYGLIKFVNAIPEDTGQGSSPDGDEPSLTTTGDGLFTDLSHPGPPATPPYKNAQPMGQICAVPFLYATCRATVVLNDGAPPVLLSATTVDSPVYLGRNTQNVPTYDIEGNGKLDGYHLVFSEPIDPVSFCHDPRQTGPYYYCHTTEWKVAGHEIVGMRTLEPGQTGPGCDRRHGCRELTIIFTENPGDGVDSFDTDERPKLEYVGPAAGSASSGLVDRAGNPMLPIRPIDGFEKDGAAPVITRVDGFLGRNNLTVTFSEPVDDGNNAALVRSNFQYYNIDHLPDGVSGLRDQAAVENKARTRTAFLWLDCPTTSTSCGGTGLTQHDIEKDTLGAEPHSIWESNPAGVLAGERQAVSIRTHAISNGRVLDLFAPANVTGLEVVDQLTSANSVTLTWTAPGDDGNGFGPVAGYRIQVSDQKIGPLEFGRATAPGTKGFNDSDPKALPNADGSPIVTILRASPTLSVTFSPDSSHLAGPGEFQKATIVGLQSDTTYHFAVAAFDDATLPCGYVVDKATGTYTAPTSPCPAGNAPDVDFRHYSGMRPQDVPISASNYDVSTKTGKDLTPPAPTPVIASTTHRANTPTPSRQAVFSWTEAKDGESSVLYHFALNQDPQYKVLDTDNFYTGGSVSPSIALDIPSDGTWYFHVAAFSGGGFTATAHYTIVVGERPIAREDIESANRLVYVDAQQQPGGNLVTWTLPDAQNLPIPVRSSPDAPVPAPGSNVQGIQVWRLDHCDGVDPACKATLAYQVNDTYDALKEGSWFDNSTDATPQSAYRVDIVFKRDQVETAAGQSHSIQNFAAVSEAPAKDMTWLWLLLAAILVVLVVGGIILASYLKRRKASQTAFTEEPQTEPSAGIDPVSGMPTHDVRCPSCQTAFQAVGKLPLQITCPKCGVSGLLQ